MGRRIKKANIQFISLVPKGANRLPVIYKEDGTFDFQLLTKYDGNELGELLAVVYAPELRDSQGDIADAAVIKDMFYTSAKDGIKLDIRHDGKALAKDQAYVAEQFIIQKSDPRFQGFKDSAGALVDVTGGWGVVMKIDSADLREKYRKGEWQGVSMGGTGLLEMEKDEGVLDRIINKLAKAFGAGGNLEKEPDMDQTQITAAVVAANLPLLAAITELTKALKGDDKKDTPAPVQKTATAAKKPTSFDDLRKQNLIKRRDAILAECEEEGVDEDTLLKAEEDCAEIEKQLAEIDNKVKEKRNSLRKSNQTEDAGQSNNHGNGNGRDNAPVITGLGKQDADLMSAGAAFARQHFGTK